MKKDKSESEEVPFDLPLSEEAKRAKQNIYGALALAAVAVAFLVASPAAVWDACGCIACFYVIYVFCFQNAFLEWPEVSIWEYLLLGAALEALLAATIMQSFGLWQEAIWRCSKWSFDLMVVCAGYSHMVRGPCWELPAGCLSGRNIVITGCNGGIGFETARVLAHAGARLVFACRSEAKARAAMKRLVSESAGAVPEAQLQFLELDVSSLASVRKFAEQLQKQKIRVHTLILNAGVMMGSRALSEDGFELTMASNHFGHFLLVQLLLPDLMAAAQRGEKPRVVVVGSMLSFRPDRFDWSEVVKVSGEEARASFLKKPYSLFRAYEQSKLANIHCTTELARRLRAKGSTLPVHVVHPGEALTDVARDIHPILMPLARFFRPVALTFLKNIRQGCISTVHAATATNLCSGQYFARLKPVRLTRLARDEVLAAKLWERSIELTGSARVV